MQQQDYEQKMENCPYQAQCKPKRKSSTQRTELLTMCFPCAHTHTHPHTITPIQKKQNRIVTIPLAFLLYNVLSGLV